MYSSADVHATFSEADLPFRATHDFDTVLIADTRLHDAANAVWSLVHDGDYRHGWGSDHTCLYRFTEPSRPGFPAMIELFGKKPDFLRGSIDFPVAPMPVDEEVSSLSAIMLDEDYYAFMLGGRRIVQGVTVLDAVHLIPFKAEAYLDLKQRRSHGEHIDSRKIKKHQRDVMRLAQLLSGNEHIALSPSIKQDMESFIASCYEEPLDLSRIGIPFMSMDDALQAIAHAFSLAGGAREDTARNRS